MIDDDFTERLLSSSPVTIRRRVIWGECDPAGVVYTPRYADYVASAAVWFIRLVARPYLADSIGTPVKALSLEFHKTLRPDDQFDMTVLVGAVRSRTFDLAIEATGTDGARRFNAQVTPILIDRATFISALIPEGCRTSLLDYAKTHSNA